MRFQCPAVSARLLRSRSASASERAPVACRRIRMRSHSTSIRSEATSKGSALAPLLVEKPLELGGLEPPRHAPVGRQKLGDHLAAVGDLDLVPRPHLPRSEEHTSELQSPCNLVCR